MLPQASDEGLEEAKKVAEKWVNTHIMPLYGEEEQALLLSTREEIEGQTNFEYLAQKYEWKGYFENDFDFNEIAERGLMLLTNYQESSTHKQELIDLIGTSAITNEGIEEKNYHYMRATRGADICRTADCEMDIKDIGYFYVIRYLVKYKDTQTTAKADEYYIDMVYVILDDKLNVLNRQPEDI